MNITLRGDDCQGFGAQWDEVLLSLKETPNEDILEGQHKTRLRDSEQFKATFALHNQDTAQKNEPASSSRLQNWSSNPWTKGRRIETSMPEMTGPRVELQSDEKVMTEAKSEDRTPGDCNQWLANGQCSCSFKHDMSKRGNGKVNVIDRVLFPRDLDHGEKTIKMCKGPRKVPARL